MAYDTYWRRSTPAKAAIRIESLQKGSAEGSKNEKKNLPNGFMYMYVLQLLDFVHYVAMYVDMII